MKSSAKPVDGVVVEFRRTLFSEDRDLRIFKAGVTLAEIAAEFDTPAEFVEYGAIQVAYADRSWPQMVPREMWGRVRPKPDAAIFISCRPADLGNGSQIFQIVAAVALIALVSFVSAGGIALLAPSLGAVFGAGTIGASVASAAIGVAGSAALALLSPPVAGASGGSAQQLAVAGAAGNALGGFQQVPALLGTMRVSPPHLMRPYTTIENTEQVVQGVVGMCGPLKIEDIKINDTPLADLDNVEVELREGWSTDTDLTLVTVQAFEENINLEMSRHRTEDDQETLINPWADSYPRPHIFRTCRDCDAFRLLLNFPQGTKNNGAGSDAIVLLYRMRIRNRAGGGWINMPELFTSSDKDQPYRIEIRLEWAANATVTTGAGNRFGYYKNAEWEADAYFYSSGAGTINSVVNHFVATDDYFTIYLDPATFPVGQYDVEITRSAATLRDLTDEDEYFGGMFTYTSTSGSDRLIPPQADRLSATYIQSYASFRNTYPIAETGLALIAFKATAMQVSSISAKFSSYVPVWDGVDWDTVDETSRNAAALLRWVLAGELNARPIPSAILDTLADFYDHCDVEQLFCDTLRTEGSVEDAAVLAAQCGDAILRRNNKWGVVIDKDRSDEGIVALFGPHNMTTPLSINRSYQTGPRAVLPTFYDAAQDYAVNEFTEPVYDDGVDETDDPIIEGAVYDGLTSEAAVTRRATLDLRRARLRLNRYSWGVSLNHLNVRKGDLVGITHDMFAVGQNASGRVKAFTHAGGNLLTITLNTEVAEVPGGDLGVKIELADGTMATIALSSVVGAVLTVSGTVALPAELTRGCYAAVGTRSSEVRRVIIADIRPGDDLDAIIDAVDEAPGIFEGYGPPEFGDSEGTVSLQAFGDSEEFSGCLEEGGENFGDIEVVETDGPPFTAFWWAIDGSRLVVHTTARTGWITVFGDSYEISFLGQGYYGIDEAAIATPPLPSYPTDESVTFEYTNDEPIPPGTIISGDGSITVALDPDFDHLGASLYGVGVDMATYAAGTDFGSVTSDPGTPTVTLIEWTVANGGASRLNVVLSGDGMVTGGTIAILGNSYAISDLGGGYFGYQGTITSSGNPTSGSVSYTYTAP